MYLSQMSFGACVRVLRMNRRLKLKHFIAHGRVANIVSSQRLSISKIHNSLI